MPDSLDLSHLDLLDAPALWTHSIRALNLSRNRIHGLWDESMPQGLEELDLTENHLQSDGLLMFWPPTLRSLRLTYNPFTVLDFVEGWPVTLRELCLDHTNLRRLPAGLPDSIEVLSIDCTDVESLPTLPAGLKSFSAVACRLRSLPAAGFPAVLESLSLYDNFLTSKALGAAGPLPAALRSLDLGKNRLTEWPRGLPAGLRTLHLQRNRIRAIGGPGAVPTSLELVALTHNSLFDVPSWLADRRATFWLLSDNALLEPAPRLPTILDAQRQWFDMAHLMAVSRIQRAWRCGRARRRLAALRRCRYLRPELLALSMHPDRAGSFEDISREWGGEPRSRSRSQP